jgi:ubiquinone/menaquinone biosynthesis C-methylase UbiE
VDDPFSKERAQAAYDVAADDYVAAFGQDLARLPLDRRMLNQALKTADDGVILDLGCGTGSAGSYLIGHGGQVVGLDLSFGMLRSCRSLNRFPVCQGDMRHLPFRDEAFSAVVAYYSIHSVRRAEAHAVLGESARVLKSHGTLLLSTHLGNGEVYFDEFLGHRIAKTGGTLYSAEEIAGSVSSAGFSIETTELRGPLQHEHQSLRIYLLAKRDD